MMFGLEIMRDLSSHRADATRPKIKITLQSDQYDSVVYQQITLPDMILPWNKMINTFELVMSHTWQRWIAFNNPLYD